VGTPPSAPPGISPTGGEIGWARWLPQTTGHHMNRKFMARHCLLPISLLVGEMPGRAEGGDTAHLSSKYLAFKTASS